MRTNLMRTKLNSLPVACGIAVLAGVYFVAGKLGLALAFVHPSATAVWPCSGIALAAFLVLGYRVWPGIFLGAFLVNITTAGSVGTSIGIAMGNTLEGLAGAYLVNRFANGRHAFERPQDILKFAVLAGMMSTTVSATFGVTSLSLGGFANWSGYSSIWLTWWLGDAVGDLVVAPPLVLWSVNPRLRWNRDQALEAILLLLFILFVSQAVFGELSSTLVNSYPIAYFCVPILVWTAYRFGQRETATAIFVLSGIATWGTLLGFGPFLRQTQQESLLLLQTFMGSTALMAMAFSAVVSEHKRAEETNARLAAIVESSNDAIIGTTLDGLVTSWNKGAARIFGYTAEEVIGKPVTVLIPPDRVNEEPQIIERLKRGERIHNYETVRRRKDGVGIHVSLTISPIKDATGRIIGASKIARDITDRKRAEEALRESEERLAADLDAMTRLQKVGTLFVREGGVPAVLDEIVEVAIAITGADMGNIQLLDARSGSLKIVAHRGFEQPFLDFWNTVHKGEGACGTALERGGRVIVEDVTRSPIFVGKPALEVMLEAGARAVQSTMLLSRSGRLLGVFSTHYRTPRRPDERALQLLDVLARQTADLIERAQAEAALRESETRFRVMADTTPALVWTSGPDALFTFFNKPWLEFTGQTLEHELGNGWAEDIHPEDRQRCLEIYRSAFDARKEFKMEYRLRRADGEYRWILDNGVPRYESDGTFAGYVGSCIDITEDKLVADEIRRLNVELEERVYERTAQLEAANKELESFSYSVSHDLRAPLRSIDGFSLALLEDCADKLNAQGKDYLRRVRDATQRMARLIDHLLKLARVTREEMRRERVDLSALARSIAADLKKTQPDRKVTFAIADGVIVNGDTHLLRVALENLLGNAWKFTRNRPKAKIEVGITKQNGKPEAYFVRDDGAGFDMTYASKLFGAFQRLHANNEFEGTGIGLATVKRVIRRHGGHIWAESAVGQGATFYFTLQPSEGSRQIGVAR